MSQSNKRKKHIGLWILLLLLLLAGILAFCQRENIKAFLQSRLSVAEIEQQLTDNDRNLAGLHVRDLTDEEKQALRDGSKTREEILEDLIDDVEKTPYEMDLSKLIAEIYLLRFDYTSELEGMVLQAKEEYQEKNEDERGTKELIKWGKTYIARANDMEKECDAKMENILNRMKALIKQYDEDDAIIGKVVAAYAKEKSLKKSWYLAQMREKGLLE